MKIEQVLFGSEGFLAALDLLRQVLRRPLGCVQEVWSASDLRRLVCPTEKWRRRLGALQQRRRVFSVGFFVAFGGEINLNVGNGHGCQPRNAKCLAEGFGAV